MYFCISNVNVEEREEPIPFVYIYLCHSIAVYVPYYFSNRQKTFCTKDVSTCPNNVVMSLLLYRPNGKVTETFLLSASVHCFFFAYSTLCIGIVDVRQMNFTRMK